MNIPTTGAVSLLPGNHKKEIASLVITLNRFHSLSDYAVNYLNEILLPVSFKKGKLLLKADDLCNHVYFIRKGAIRGFIKEGTREITTWITAENEMVTSISGLDLREPNEENMQAIEDCDTLALSYSDLEKLYLKFPEFNIVVRKILQQYYKDAEDRAFIVRLTNAETRYRYFLNRYSHLTNRVPLKYIASFLGITLETLSRVRKKISVQPKVK